MKRDLIKCNSINYRKGYIEVLGGIHDECINLEVWNIHPDVDITSAGLGDESFPENAVASNTEIELSLEKAELLIEQLTLAVNKIRENNSP
ncbi:hypothetical protein N480_00775 [Pseudoalteromonas luteoviolacea S2607]|uniref:hypothetical protein n=1 Tax=Pseudoalteromonas luteoviolacea TaxID=43657 RepID=UPI0007B08341|nr:hypothetical protein [Pseudoalteromonas luteoviolacea]KZN39396.1 hypothetical protein N480_00775 [Pseudoalteromonas luteoviolacea S2607]